MTLLEVIETKALLAEIRRRGFVVFPVYASQEDRLAATPAERDVGDGMRVIADRDNAA